MNTRTLCEQRRLDYSIVIASFRRPTLLRNTVEMMLPQVQENGEVIVVEQEPIFDLSGVFATMPRVRHAVLSRRGTCCARNHGIRLARGEIVLFLDDDVMPHSGLIQEHLKMYADQTIGGVAGRSIEDGIEPATDIDPRSLDAIHGWWYSHFDHLHMMDVEHAPTKNLSFRTSLLREIGGFDQRFRLAWREDSDVCFRVRKLGYRIVYQPAASLVHLHASEGGTRGFAETGAIRRELQMYQKHYLHYRDNLYFILRHFNKQDQKHWLWRSYRDYVGVSRWPWRLLAKNFCFAFALFEAAHLVRRPIAGISMEGGPCPLQEK